MLKDYYIQPDVPDPVLSDDPVLALTHQHMPEDRAAILTGYLEPR